MRTARAYADLNQEQLVRSHGRRGLRVFDQASTGMLLVAGLVALALVLRLVAYALNPSLSVDEASLALNIMDRSYFDLFRQLDFNQAAPAGFLVVQKLVVQAFGSTPYALRVVPLVAGLVGVLLIYPVAKSFAGRKAALVALALFAISEPLITYASTNKQYSVDAAVTLGLYAMAIALPRPSGYRQVGILALGGVVAVWLSHPASFVLAAIGTVLIFDTVISRRWRDTALLGVALTTWLVSFLVAYEFTRSSVEQVRHSIAHSSPSSLAGGGGQPGLLQSYGGIARSLLGIPSLTHGIRSVIALAAMLLALVGLATMLRARTRDAVLLALPAAIALIVSRLHLYPLYPRTFLFLVPALVILVALGAEVLNRRGRITALLASATLVVLFSTSMYAAVDHLRSSSESGTPQALQYLVRKARPGDSIYLYLTSQYDYRYYVECGCFGTEGEAAKARSLWPLRPTGGHAQFAPALQSTPRRVIAGKTTSPLARDYRGDLQPVAGRPRVWVLVIDPNPNDSAGLQTFLRANAARKGSFIRSTAEPPASVFLYDFRARG
jgi:Dolichyl-phosphate-mannose-protein mannosyltransferase